MNISQENVFAKVKVGNKKTNKQNKTKQKPNQTKQTNKQILEPYAPHIYLHFVLHDLQLL